MRSHAFWGYQRGFSIIGDNKAIILEFLAQIFQRIKF